MSRKIKKNIETQLHMRGNAEIEKWAEAALEIPDPKDIDQHNLEWEDDSDADADDTLSLEELMELKEQRREEREGL